MWARVNAASVQQENVVNMMQVDMLQLGVLQTQLDNVSLQATLIIGFALAMWSGDIIGPLSDDSSARCLYKTWLHMLLGLLFFMAVAACISLCFVVVVIASCARAAPSVIPSSFAGRRAAPRTHAPSRRSCLAPPGADLKQASQGSALLVSTRAAVANTRVHIRMVYGLFVRAVFCFLGSAALLIWLLIGLPARIPVSPNSDRIEHDDDELTRLDNGEYQILCIDVHSPADSAKRDAYSFWLATVNTALITSMCGWGFFVFARVRATYEANELLTWYGKYKIQERRNHDAIRASALPESISPQAELFGEEKKKKKKAQPELGTEEETYYPYDDHSDPDSLTGVPPSVPLARRESF